MVQEVGMYIAELADLYAGKTLARYLRELDPNVRIYFASNFQDPYKIECLGNEDFRLKEKLDSHLGGLEISFISDIRSSPNMPETTGLGIDISLLKNAAYPYTEEEKSKLRIKHGIPLDKKILVAGELKDERTVLGLVKRFEGTVVVNNLIMPYMEETRQAYGDEKLIACEGYGKLKELFACADVAIHGHMIEPQRRPMHNFVEASEGGPLFLSVTANPCQFGYKFLVKSKVLREGLGREDVVESATYYGNNLSEEDKKQHTSRRNAHLQNTRDLFIRPIAELILNYTGSFTTDAISQKGLATNLRQGCLSVMHEETSWNYVVYDAIARKNVLMGISRALFKNKISRKRISQAASILRAA